MNFWLIAITVLNILLLVGLTINVFLRVKEKKEDLRINKGLQHLQNKISVLEDLSDKTDKQVRNLLQIMDQKNNDLHDTMEQAESQRVTMTELMHQCIHLNQTIQQTQAQIQSQQPQDFAQQKTQSYVIAAKLAHQGNSLEQILEQVDLSPAEVSMIIKVNKDQLQFDESQIPQWMKIQNQNKTSKHEFNQNELDQFSHAIQQQNMLYKSVTGEMPNHFEENINQFNRVENTSNFQKSNTFNSINHQSEKVTINNNTPQINTHTQGSESTINIKPYEFKKLIVNK